MTAIILLIVVLLLSVAALVFWPWRDQRAADRDALNQTLYHSRLRELDDEPPEARQALALELQRSLLADIPARPAQAPAAVGRGTLLT
ncbi:c-type cytochrome biogenesis protein CcmI, partial [Cronobacter muytjensii]|nr:c-type cytochrome biogenesis protein CcmI [Cronobacter muytjensii]